MSGDRVFFSSIERAARAMCAPAPDPDFEEWLRRGVEAGFCGPPVCQVHDGLPTSADEDAEWDEFGEICAHVLRLYRDAEHKAAVEANHAPSVWRATNRGLMLGL